MNTVIRRFFFLFLFLFCFSIVPFVHAADFTSSYDVEYFIKEDTTQDYIKAAYTIHLTNLQPDKIVSSFSISFPKSFDIGNIEVNDDQGPIIPQITQKDRYINVAMKFNDPKPGLNETNSLYMNFMQKNVFRAEGAIWEILIPTVQSSGMTLNSVVVNFPPGQNKKLSIAKPVPDNVTVDTVTWKNVKNETIYAVFGSVQNYSLKLNYHLTNPNLYRVYTDIALPPDTLYQQVITQSLLPAPDLIYSDTDGNALARYTLQPRENKDVVFEGYAKIYAAPRADFASHIQSQFENEKQSLFNSQPLWTLTANPLQSKDVQTIYNFVTDKLTYNFSRVIKGNSRLGAAQALTYPDQAVCTEYSDVFVAIARQNGFYAREIQGYGFATDQELRPIQDNSDILHSWVEYYDVSKSRWIPIDPTWQDTSGIDYFSSFDFDHIVFAIHGKQADYPYPAGSYKSDPTSKDVYVAQVVDVPAVQKKVSAQIDSLPLPSDIAGEFTLKFTLKNDSNVSIWDSSISPQLQGGTTDAPSLPVDYLLPGETKAYSLSFKPDGSLFYQTVAVTLSFGGETVGQKTITVPTFIATFQRFEAPILLILCGGLFALLFFRRKK